MHVLELEECVKAAEHLVVEAELVDVRASGEVSVHHYLEGVVAQAELVEVPVVIVGFVIEIQAVESVDPADLDLDVQGGLVDALVLAAVVPHLFHRDGVALRHDVPVGELSVYAGNLVLRELEDLESGFCDLDVYRPAGEHGLALIRVVLGSQRDQGEGGERGGRQWFEDGHYL